MTRFTMKSVITKFRPPAHKQAQHHQRHQQLPQTVGVVANKLTARHQLRLLLEYNVLDHDDPQVTCDVFVELVAEPWVEDLIGMGMFPEAARRLGRDWELAAIVFGEGSEMALEVQDRVAGMQDAWIDGLYLADSAFDVARLRT